MILMQAIYFLTGNTIIHIHDDGSSVCTIAKNAIHFIGLPILYREVDVMEAERENTINIYLKKEEEE